MLQAGSVEAWEAHCGELQRRQLAIHALVILCFCSPPVISTISALLHAVIRMGQKPRAACLIAHLQSPLHVPGGQGVP